MITAPRKEGWVGKCQQFVKDGSAFRIWEARCSGSDLMERLEVEYCENPEG